MQVLVLSDTHVRASGGPTLPPRVLELAAAADAVLHAGDVVAPALLERLAGLAPVHAVLGNNDHELAGALPERLEVELGGVRVAMVHDSGSSTGRAMRLQRWFPDADVVVFGHSHLPHDGLGAGRQRLFNPGSPTQRRMAPQHTVGLLELDGGRVRSHRIVPVE